MKINHVLSIFIIALVFAVSCKKDDTVLNSQLNAPVSNTQSIDDGDPKKDWRTLFVMEVQTEQGIIVKDFYCWYPQSSCFPDIVVTPKGGPKLYPANNFKTAVSEGTTSAFFGTSDALVLFEDLGEDTLELLQNPDITIVQNPGINSDGEELYFVAELDDVDNLYNIYGCDTITSDSAAKADCMKDMLEVLYDDGGIIFTFPFYYEE